MARPPLHPSGPMTAAERQRRHRRKVQAERRKAQKAAKRDSIQPAPHGLPPAAMRRRSRRRNVGTTTDPVSLNREEVESLEAKYDELLASRLMSIADINTFYKREFLRTIQHWAGLYYSCYHDAQQHPDYKEIFEKLKMVRGHCIQLHKLLHEHYTLVEILGAADGYDDAHISALLNAPSALKQLVQIALRPVWEKKKSKQGSVRCGQVRQAAVDDLGHIWLMFTDKRPKRRVQNPATHTPPQSYGPFHEFVKAALLPIFGASGTTGVDADIRETCRRMANSPSLETPLYIHMRSAP